MLTHPELLALLADGRFHSGESIARECGFSRAAVWKKVNGLRQGGIPIDSVPGRGYRINGGFDLLNADMIRACLAERDTDPVDIHCLWEIDSTSSFLRDSVPPSRRPVLVVAERQTAGRGRRGKSWYSAMPGNLALSIGHRLDCAPAALSGLSLVAGMAAAQCIRDYAVDVRVKWPNDLFVGTRKLGGILLEISAELGGPTRVVTGIGLNVSSAAVAPGQVDQPWCALDELIDRTAMPSRNELIGRLFDQLDRDYRAFSRDGFGVFQQRWQTLDFLAGQRVEVQLGSGSLVGIAEGIAATGDLLVRVEGRLTPVNAGEVSVRRAT